MLSSAIDEHVLNTINEFKSSICNICERECYNIKEVYEELKKHYCPETPHIEIMKRAHVAENAIRRTVSDKSYNGLREEGCIRVALALGVDNEEDIDYLLNARGYAGLRECNRKDYVIWRNAVMLVFRLQKEQPDDILPENAVLIFEESIKKA